MPDVWSALPSLFKNRDINSSPHRSLKPSWRPQPGKTQDPELGLPPSESPAEPPFDRALSWPSDEALEREGAIAILGYPILLPLGDGSSDNSDGTPPAWTKHLYKQLNPEELNEMHAHLWWAGWPGNIRPLHEQKIKRRDILLTEHVRLHLTWVDSTIYIKPLPVFMLNWAFFDRYLCQDAELLGMANGLFMTYTKLIQFPCDLAIAHDAGLVPKEMAWQSWSALSTSLQTRLAHNHNPERYPINKRYIYGELRLRRLNHIYRFGYWRGEYLALSAQYDHFFAVNFAWLLLLVVYLSCILSAMQVVLSTKKVPDMLNNASYGFSIFAMVFILFGIAAQALIFIALFLYNLKATICNLRQKRIDWAFSWFFDAFDRRQPR